MYRIRSSAVALASLVQLCAPVAGHAENPVCSPAMAPAQCAEAQISAIGRIFGEYKADIARLEDQISANKSEIADLKKRVLAAETLTASIDKETKPTRPGGQGCLLVHTGDPIPGWQYKGYFGLIQLRPFAPGSSDGFTRGAAFNPDWYWEHEDIFCAK